MISSVGSPPYKGVWSKRLGHDDEIDDINHLEAAVFSIRRLKKDDDEKSLEEDK